MEELVRPRVHCGIDRGKVNDRVVPPHRAFECLEVQDVDGPVRLMRAAVDPVGDCHVVVGLERRHHVASQHAVSAGDHDAFHVRASRFG